MKLNKCKHCGKAAHYAQCGGGKYFVYCESALKARGICSRLYQSPKRYETKEQAVEAWNKYNQQDEEKLETSRWNHEGFVVIGKEGANDN